MDPWASILNKAGDYGPWGLVIAAMGLALAWATLRNAKLQDMRADDGRENIKALVESTNATEKFTPLIDKFADAMNLRTDAINDLGRQSASLIDAVKELRAGQERFLEKLANRDERNAR